MRSLRTGLAAIAALVTLATLTACSSSSSADAGASPAADAGSSSEGFAKDSNTLVFGVVPDSESTQDNFKPLADYTAKVTGKQVEYFQAADYNALIEAAVAGKIDVASFSGFTYYNAWKAGAQITPFSAIVTGGLTEPGYYSVAIANPKAGITSLADYKGKKVCFVSETSTSGYLFPSKALLEAQVDPAKDVTPVFAGKHDASADKVAAGTECEAGFAEDAVADPLIEEGKLVEVDRQLVPGAPMVYSNSLPQDVKDSITSNLSDVTAQEIEDTIGMTDAAQKKNFEEWITSLKPVDDAYYDQIRDLCKVVTTAEACAAA